MLPLGIGCYPGPPTSALVRPTLPRLWNQFSRRRHTKNMMYLVVYLMLSFSFQNSLLFNEAIGSSNSCNNFWNEVGVDQGCPNFWINDQA